MNMSANMNRLITFVDKSLKFTERLNIVRKLCLLEIQVSLLKILI